MAQYRRPCRSLLAGAVLTVTLLFRHGFFPERGSTAVALVSFVVYLSRGTIVEDRICATSSVQVGCSRSGGRDRQGDDAEASQGFHLCHPRNRK